MTEGLRELLAALPQALAGHLVITVVPLTLAVAVSVPLGLWAVDRPRARGAALLFTGLVQTIPGLALLALMVPVLVAVGAVLAPLGVAVPALGALPVGIALTLYAMLPILRNTVTGIAQVDPAILDAARGLGMRETQVRLQVSVPLALPVMLAGIRTAAVWVVGMGTLATPVGQDSLGNFIFAGLQTRNALSVLVGCLGSAALALLVDGTLALVTVAFEKRRPGLAALPLAVLAVVLGLGMSAPALLRTASTGPRVVVGGKPFTEQYILGRVLSDRLAAAGFTVDRREGLGTSIVLEGLKAGQVHVAVDYSGTLWAHHLGRKGSTDSETVLSTVCESLDKHDGIACVGPLGFENAYALAVRRSDAEQQGWRSLADLAPHAARMTVGADYEFFRRDEWQAVRKAYGLAFAAEKTFDPTFLYDAIGDGTVDLVTVYTSDGRVAASDLVLLEDPKGALPPYDAVILVSHAAPAGVAEALAPLVGQLDVATMREANRQVDVAGKTPTQAANWLRDELVGAR